MTTEWRFYPQQSTDTARNPISGEFFSSEAVGNAAEAVVREGIQNSLDARPKPFQGPAEVRIFLSGTANPLPAEKAQRWFGGLWKHVAAPSNGLRDQPNVNQPVSFLVFEDFGTFGLTGDPTEHEFVAGQSNNFLNFFRAEGHSDKGEHDRGSWGVGKTVFPRASRISSFFGLTVRADDGKHYLLGRSILKYHKVDGQSYKSDGYFGIVREPDGFVLPCDNTDILADFRSDFHLNRDNEAGLSLVVPWCDEEITRDAVLRAVLHGFFYPILMGHLSVNIATPDGETSLRANSIIDTVESLGGALKDTLLPLLQLAEWAQTCTDDEFRKLTPPPPDRAQKWSPSLLPESAIKDIRESLAQRNRVALQVPMAVHPRDEGPQPTAFSVFLEHSDDSPEKPTFIRDELIITDVKSPRIPQVRSMVIVEDKPLAKLLRDAETPAHTQWTTTTSNFKNRYKFGPGAIEFVRRSVSEIVRTVNQAEQEPDPSLTIDYFSIPAPPDDEEAVPARRRKKKRKAGKTSGGAGGGPPPQPRRFRVDPLHGGFRISRGHPDAEMPERLHVQVAYDVRRGNPFRKYHSNDFELGEAPIRLKADNASVEVASMSGMWMELVVNKPDFGIDVIGFDPDRDIKVNVKVQEANDATD